METEYYIILAVLLCAFVIYRIRERMNDKKWERIRQEREEKERLMWSRFTSFFYPEKVPFDFDSDCYIYVENRYDERLNRIIETHLDDITLIFKERGFRFLYIPRWNPNQDLLGQASLDEDAKLEINKFFAQRNTVEYTRLLCKALQIDFDNIKSGIFHFACYVQEDISDPKIESSKFTVYSLDSLQEDKVLEFFEEYCDFIVEAREHPSGCFFSMAINDNLTFEESLERYYGYSDLELSDYRFPKDMKDIADDIKQKIGQLKDGGYYELLLHTLGSELVEDLKNTTFKPKLSRLQITDDFKILLADYNKEIHLTPLQKTLYIFYLRHPEGVEFKYLSLYYNELLAIYRVLSNRENDEKQRESIRRLVDSLDNAINEKCSRIKEAFLKVTDDFVARNYYITLEERKVQEKDKKNHFYHERLKRIVLPRELVIYPKEIERIEIIQPNDKEDRRMEMKDEEKCFSDLKRSFREKGASKQELIEQFTEFTKPPKLRYAAYFYRAILYTHIGMYEEALADNQLLIDRNPNTWAEALVNKAETLYFLKRYDEAIVEMENYTKYRKNISDGEYFLIRSKIYEALGRTEEAKADIEEYERLSRNKKK